MHAGDSAPRALSLAAPSLGHGRAYSHPTCIVFLRTPRRAAEEDAGTAAPHRSLGPVVWRLAISRSHAAHPAAPPRWQVCKAKLGSHKRAKSKREDMAESMRQARMADKK